MSKFDRFLDDLRKPGLAERHISHVATPKTGDIRNLPEGGWIADGVYCTELRFKIGEPYGAVLFERPERMRIMRSFGAAEALIFLDLETTGLAGGTGTYAFLCGIGVAEGEFFKVLQFFLEGPAREKNWLEAIDAIVPKDACLVTYNGKTFDLPLLRTRHILSRSVPTWDRAPHIDLLQHARRLYRGRLESCSLGSMERHVLRVERTGEDIPGWQIPALYAEYLRSRDASKLHGVFYHNRQDILSLAALYCRVAHILEGNSEDGLDLTRAGDLWEACGYGERANELWNRACAFSASRVEAHSRRAFQAKRASDFAGAHREFLLALEAAKDTDEGCGDRIALYTLLEEIAKLEEHRLGMPRTALAHANEALQWLFSHRYLLGRAFSQMHREMQRRVARLNRKTEKES